MEEDIKKLQELTKTLEARVNELERVVKALITMAKEQENETWDEYIPAGEYYGTKF